MFYEKYLKATKEKDSFININLDPALPKQRKNNVIPPQYISKEDRETLLNFSFDIIEQVSDYCCSVKPNTQYYHGNTDILKKIAEKIENAGAIFIGDYSPVAVGDYWAGPSHTLPTGMTAKFFSALSANDFIKSTSIIEYDKEKLAASAEDIIRLAEIEGLDAHAKSIKIRQST